MNQEPCICPQPAGKPHTSPCPHATIDLPAALAALSRGEEVELHWHSDGCRNCGWTEIRQDSTFSARELASAKLRFRLRPKPRKSRVADMAMVWDEGPSITETKQHFGERLTRAICEYLREQCMHSTLREIYIPAIEREFLGSAK